MRCHQCGRRMKAPALTQSVAKFDPSLGRVVEMPQHLGPRCAAKVGRRSEARRGRSEVSKIAALFRRPRAVAADDSRQMVLPLEAM